MTLDPGRRHAVLAVASLIALLPMAAAAEQVGVVVEAVHDVTGTPPGGAAAPLAVGDPVVLDLLVATGPDSEAALLLAETATVRLGPQTRQRVTRAYVDQATGEADSWIEVLLGRLRLAVAGAFRGRITVDTPSATIGVKGTVLVVDVAAAGDTVVWVLEGEVEVTAKAGGPPLTLRAGQSTAVAPGARPSLPAPFDPATLAAASRALPLETPAPAEDAIEDSPVEPVIENLPPRPGPNEPPSGDPGQRPG